MHHDDWSIALVSGSNDLFSFIRWNLVHDLYLLLNDQSFQVFCSLFFLLSFSLFIYKPGRFYVDIFFSFPVLRSRRQLLVRANSNLLCFSSRVLLQGLSFKRVRHYSFLSVLLKPLISTISLPIAQLVISILVTLLVKSRVTVNCLLWAYNCWVQFLHAKLNSSITELHN